jgi:hypothetical protein
MTYNQYHWIDNNLRSSQKFESLIYHSQGICGGFYKLTDIVNHFTDFPKKIC